MLLSLQMEVNKAPEIPLLGVFLRKILAHVQQGLTKMVHSSTVHNGKNHGTTAKHINSTGQINSGMFTQRGIIQQSKRTSGTSNVVTLSDTMLRGQNKFPKTTYSMTHFL